MMHVYLLLECVSALCVGAASLLLIHQEEEGEGVEVGSHSVYGEAGWWGQRVAVVREHRSRRGGPGVDNVAMVVVGSAHAPLSSEGGRNEREAGQADDVGATVHMIY